MAFIGSSSGAELTQRQRWGMYLTVIFSIAAGILGVGLRDSALYATTVYINREVGIQARYPQNWLIDTDGDYVFRVRGVSQLGFKTAIQVAIYPVSTEAVSARNILDILTLRRSQVLTGYNVQSIVDVALADGTPAAQMNYSYVATGTNPFLESIPIVVRGIDLLVARQGQAIVVTFWGDALTFEQDVVVFERFLQDLRFS